MPEHQRRELTAGLKSQIGSRLANRDAQAFALQIQRGKGFIGANFGRLLKQSPHLFTSLPT